MKISQKIKRQIRGKKSLFFMSNINSLAIIKTEAHLHFKSLNRNINKEMTRQLTEVEIKWLIRQSFKL